MKRNPLAALFRDTAPVTWPGASVRNIADETEMSAFGLPSVRGVLVLEVPAESALAKAGLQKNDVILSVNGRTTQDMAMLLRQAPALPAGRFLKIGFARDQQEYAVQLSHENL